VKFCGLDARWKASACHIHGMKDVPVSGIYVVRVRLTDQLIGGKPAVRLWAAALPRDEAVAAVQREIPSNWTAEITDQRLTKEQVRSLRMKPGSVRPMGSSG
jgi:hypothetical protein